MRAAAQRSRGMPRGAGGIRPLAVGLTVAAMIMAGCGAPPPTEPPTATPAPSASPSAPPPTSSSTTPGPERSPSSRLSSSPSVAFDPGLLSILPPAVDGAQVLADPESLPDAAANAGFSAHVQSAAFAIVVDGGDLASGVLAHLRPGVYSEALYRDWRDTYSQGACSQAGGVVGNAEAQLGGRTVYVTSCAGGMRVYHAYLPERDVLVSLFSLGDRQFGEQLVRGLQP